MPITCEIHFESNENIIYSGQRFGITVRLKLTEELKFHDITFQVCGKTHVGFVRDDSRKEGSYVNNDHFLDLRKCLVDGDNGICLYSFRVITKTLNNCKHLINRSTSGTWNT